MKFTSLSALRFLQLSKKNRYFSWISTLSIAGITIGVAIMIVVLSVIDGFEAELRERYLAANAHLLMFKFPKGIQHKSEIRKEIETRFSNVITGVSPFVQSETMCRKDSSVQAILVKGIHPNLRRSVQHIKKLITPQTALEQIQHEIDSYDSIINTPNIPGVILGVGLLKKLETKIGDTISMISPGKHDEQKIFTVILLTTRSMYQLIQRMVSYLIPILLRLIRTELTTLLHPYIFQRKNRNSL